MLSDTVGFIADLPHDLVAAFRATLEEVTSADVILHVRDIANPDHAAQAGDVLKVLVELGVNGETVPVIEAWNKIDLLPPGTAASALPAGTVLASVPVSAVSGQGLDALLAEIETALARRTQVFALKLPHAEGAGLGWLYAHAEILERHEPDMEGTLFSVRVQSADREAFFRRFRPFLRGQESV